MRHGQAQDHGPQGDGSRALTAIGRDQARRAGEVLTALGRSPAAAVSSPLVRAQQTLRGVLLGLNPDAPPPKSLPTDGRLVPSASPSMTIAAIVEAAAPLDLGACVLAVGHNPSVTATLGALIGAQAMIAFNVSPGDLAHLHVDTSGRELRAVVLGFYPAHAVQALRAD